MIGFSHSPWHSANSPASASTSCDSRLYWSNSLAWWEALLVQEFPEDPVAYDFPSAKLLPSIMMSKSTWDTEKSSTLLGLLSKGIAHDTILNCIDCVRLERICATQESPASCCQQMVSETSGQPWCVISKKSSNQQFYCGDTHPVNKWVPGRHPLWG